MTLNISRTSHANDPQPYPDTHHVQARLEGKGFDVGPYGIDGYFGPGTEAALKNFQRRIGATVNGIVDKNILAKLDAVATVSSAKDMADRAYRLVTTGNDGTPPHYRLGAEVANLSEPSPDEIDCSELVQWSVYQAVHNSWVDGSWNQAAHCKLMSVAAAVKIKGALLFVSNNGKASGVHHVAISMGNGRTAEARSAHLTPNCGSWQVGTRFSFGGLVPVLKY